MSYLFIVTTLLGLMDPVQHNDWLDDLRWKNRVILLFTDDLDNEEATRQVKHFLGDTSGFRERDLVYYFILPDQVLDEKHQIINTAKAVRIRQEYSVEGALTFILIGKDGGEKYRSSRFVPREELYALIDAMPMRRAEMKKAFDGNPK